MATDEERREVARRLRELPDDAGYSDLAGAIAGNRGWYVAADAAHRLVDLIEPGASTTPTPLRCVTDASATVGASQTKELLKLADEMLDAFRVGARSGEGIDAKWCRELHDDYDRRIREALGVTDG